MPSLDDMSKLVDTRSARNLKKIVTQSPIEWSATDKADPVSEFKSKGSLIPSNFVEHVYNHSPMYTRGKPSTLKMTTVPETMPLKMVDLKNNLETLENTPTTAPSVKCDLSTDYNLLSDFKMKSTAHMKDGVVIKESECVALTTFMKDDKLSAGKAICKPLNGVCPIKIDNNVCEIVPLDVNSIIKSL